jgi:hypothetical protein
MVMTATRGQRELIEGERERAREMEKVRWEAIEKGVKEREERWTSEVVEVWYKDASAVPRAALGQSRLALAPAVCAEEMRRGEER